jgi:hypothetical protein
MFETYKITTTRGEVYVFSAQRSLDVKFQAVGGAAVLIVSSIESVVRSTDIEGEVAS